jgi:HEAT repeat protein
MRTHRCLRFLVALLAAVLAGPVLAGEKPKEKGGAKPSPIDKDLEEELFVVFERGTRSADMETRATAVETIGRLRPEVAKDYVVDALKDPQWVVRYSAIKALILQANLAYREALGNAVANPTLYETRELNPLNLVLSLTPDEAIQLLQEALAKVADVRGLILKEIFKRDSPLAKQFYEKLREVPEVKSWVMANLGIFEDKNMFPLLLKTLPSLDKENLLKVFAFLEAVDATYDLTFLKTYLKHEDQDIMEGAAYILASRGDVEAIELMLPICDENDVHRQIRCLKALRGAPNHPEVKERAKLFLYGDPDPEVLYAVYDIFTLAADDSIYNRIVQRLQSTNLGHRATAVYFLGKMRGNRALPQLHELLRDGSPLIRQRAAQAIGELRQAESIPALADALRNEPDVAVKKELVKSMGLIGERSILDTVSFLIFDPTVKDEAIAALAGVRHRDAIPTLRNILQNQFSKEQRAIALKSVILISPAEGYQIFKGCLGWIPPGFLEDMAKELKGEFVSYLTASLESLSDVVRTEAVMAFRHMGAELEIKVLEKELFASSDARLRVLILTRMVELKKEEALALLASFFKDSNRLLRLAAVRLAATVAKPGDPAVEELRNMLMDPDETFRVAAAVSVMDIYLRAQPQPAAPGKAPAKPPAKAPPKTK